jgi:DNA-directed RNA polymerase subunit E'/Rpb7
MSLDIFNNVLCYENIKLEPIYLSLDYQDEILKRLKDKLEGKYTKHGFINNDSIKIHKICPGAVDMIGLNGYVVFKTYFKANICNPLIGSIVKAKVININRFGILLSGLHNNKESILEIIVAKNSVNITSDIDLEEIKKDEIYNVEILGKKTKFNNTKIYSIGRIINDEYNMNTVNSRNESIEEEEDVDDVQVEEDIDENINLNEEDLDDEVNDEIEEEDEVIEEDEEEDIDEDEIIDDEIQGNNSEDEYSD